MLKEAKTCAIKALGAFLLLIMALLSSAVAAELEATASEKARQAFSSSVRFQNLQTQLPGNAGRSPENAFIQNREYDASFANFISPQLARIMLGVAVLVLVIVILLTLRNNLWGSRRSRKLNYNAPEETNARAERMDQAQVEAEVMAQAGYYAEAMHILLLQSVGELRRHLDVAIAVSLTSREIMHKLELSASLSRWWIILWISSGPPASIRPLKPGLLRGPPT